MSEELIIKQSYLETECCFEIKIVYTDQQPSGFQPWVEQVKFEKCKLILPDNTRMDIRKYIDMNNTLDNGALTKYLLNRYNETI